MKRILFILCLMQSLNACTEIQKNSIKRYFASSDSWAGIINVHKPGLLCTGSNGAMPYDGPLIPFLSLNGVLRNPETGGERSYLVQASTAKSFKDQFDTVKWTEHITTMMDTFAMLFTRYDGGIDLKLELIPQGFAHEQCSPMQIEDGMMKLTVVDAIPEKACIKTRPGTDEERCDLIEGVMMMTFLHEFAHYYLHQFNATESERAGKNFRTADQLTALSVQHCSIRGLRDSGTIHTNVSIAPNYRRISLDEIRRMKGLDVARLAARFSDGKHNDYNSWTDVLFSYILWILADRNGLEMQFEEPRWVDDNPNRRFKGRYGTGFSFTPDLQNDICSIARQLLHTPLDVNAQWDAVLQFAAH